ncbi:hypothetical protein [Limobrevibacterium gyesilva]|nr:hypothetical protein [Limobrevibacterium gyesilva]
MADGPGYWQPHPHPHRAPLGAWRWVIAVRQGPVPRFDAVGLYDPQEPGDAMRQLHLLPSAAERAIPVAIFGGSIVDCLAVDISLTKPPLRLTGFADVLGDPPEWGEDRAVPMRIHRNVRDWLGDFCRGLVLIGADTGAHQAALLRCQSGVVGSDVAHARALKKLIERPHPAAPPIFVADSDRSEAA